MNRSALLVSLVGALLTATLGGLYINRAEKELSGGEKVRLVTVTHDVKAGAPLRAGELAVRGVPMAYAETRAVRASDLERVVGLEIATALEPGQTLMWTDLKILHESRRDLSSLVQPGKRAYTIIAKGPAHSAKLIQPGDYVDVLGTLQDTTVDKAVVLLQKVLVLAVGERTLPTAQVVSKQQAGQALTLSLDLRGAQVVALAQQKGALRVVLRNPEDQRVATEVPDLDAQSLLNKEEREPFERGRRIGGGPIRLGANQ